MYQPLELARFTISEFERGLEGIGAEEARVRLKKADGSEMNAVSWAVAHIARHWLARTRPRQQLDFRPQDPTNPPPLTDALAWLAEGKALVERTLGDVDSQVLSQTGEGERENRGTALLRAVLHTWFHTGEINAIRQLLGHAEIGFVGNAKGNLEWRGGAGVLGGYRPEELARFAISEFERGLEGLNADEWSVRTAKRDGTEMNAISWTVAHVATHWLFDAALMTGERMQGGSRGFFGRGADPTPPSHEESRALMAEARSRTEGWLPSVSDELLSAKRDIGPQADENLGTQLMRAVLHTWFHIGEINAVRQQLGHAEIAFVGQMAGALEWRSG